MDWSKTRVLLIHSDIHVRRWAHDVLHRQKVASVQSTRSPATGLALLARFDADIAIVQLQQPEMSGVEFARRLRDAPHSRHPQLPVVLIVDTPNAALLGEARKADIAGVVSWPMTAESFLERIAAATTDRRDRRPITNPALAVPARLAVSAVPQRLAVPAHRDTIEMSDRPVATPRPPIPLAPPAAAPVPRHGADEWADAVAPETVAVPADTTLDIGPILAEHAVWLLSHGKEGSRAQLEGADLHGRSLAKTNLASAGLREADLTDTDCRLAVFVSADLRRADFSAADLGCADLSVANLRGAGLRMARLAEASLRGADLAGACLSDAVLDGTDLTGANLLDADLRKSDLSGAVGLTQEQVAKARTDASTRMPPGIRLRDPEELPPAI
jgi:DNA-binding NarL/FixJ family response regulator